LLPLFQASFDARFLQETSDGANARFNGIGELQQVRASGMHVRCRSGQEVLLGVLRAKRREQAGLGGWLRLRPLRLQARLNSPGATPVATRASSGNYCCRL
jgi:hypothetical protein